MYISFITLFIATCVLAIYTQLIFIELKTRIDFLLILIKNNNTYGYSLRFQAFYQMCRIDIKRAKEYYDERIKTNNLEENEN